MKFSSIVPSQDLQDELGLGALGFEVAVWAVSNSESEKRKPYRKWSRKVHDWKVCYHQWSRCCCKKIWIKESTSQWKYRKRVLCHVQSRVRKCQKRKTSHLNVLLRGRPLLLESLDQMVQKSLLALRSWGGLITSVMRYPLLKLFFSILYLTPIEIIFTIYNFIDIILITFAIETNQNRWMVI